MSHRHITMEFFVMKISRFWILNSDSYYVAEELDMIKRVHVEAKNIFSRFSNNSGAFSSELLENLEMIDFVLTIIRLQRVKQVW